MTRPILARASLGFFALLSVARAMRFLVNNEQEVCFRQYFPKNEVRSAHAATGHAGARGQRRERLPAGRDPHERQRHRHRQHEHGAAQLARRVRAPGRRAGVRVRVREHDEEDQHRSHPQPHAARPRNLPHGRRRRQAAARALRDQLEDDGAHQPARRVRAQRTRGHGGTGSSLRPTCASKTA
jgi:hypothetical protein